MSIESHRAKGGPLDGETHNVTPRGGICLCFLPETHTSTRGLPREALRNGWDQHVYISDGSGNLVHESIELYRPHPAGGIRRVQRIVV